METELLYCLKPHTYGNVFRKEGEPMTVRRRHSTVLIALGRATREAPKVIQFPIKAIDAPEIDTETHTEAPAISGEEVSIDDEEAIKSRLRDEYKALYGKNAHGRTSIETLRSEIEKNKAEAE